MPRHSGGERYQLELVAQADDDAPAHVRLRRFLKAALRAWGLRCTAVRELPTTTPPLAQDGTSPEPVTPGSSDSPGPF
jgi:hypothetical protein